MDFDVCGEVCVRDGWISTCVVDFEKSTQRVDFAAVSGHSVGWISTFVVSALHEGRCRSDAKLMERTSWALPCDCCPEDCFSFDYV